LSSYLLDTNIVIYYFKGFFDLDSKLKEAGLSNCFISEVTLAELTFGAAKSSKIQKNWLNLQIAMIDSKRPTWNDELCCMQEWDSTLRSESRFRA
jgi:predicted nucleic acid-binding protein